MQNFKDQSLLIRGTKDIDPFVKITAAQALGMLGVENAANFIKQEMQEKNIEIWKNGVIALAHLQDTASIAFIKEQLNDTPWELRLAAAEALLILKK